MLLNCTDFFIERNTRYRFRFTVNTAEADDWSDAVARVCQFVLAYLGTSVQCVDITLWCQLI